MQPGGEGGARRIRSAATRELHPLGAVQRFDRWYEKADPPRTRFARRPAGLPFAWKEALASDLQRIEPRVGISPWLDHEHGYAVMALPFSSGHVLSEADCHRVREWIVFQMDVVYL